MISVCMALYNGERFLGSQINSILLQLSPQDELIIVNDCSVDRSKAVIESFSDERIRIIDNLANIGVVKTFEKALNAAQGDYIFLSDQDDVWLPGRVARMLEELVQNDLVVSNALIIDENSNLVETSDFFAFRRSKSGFLKNFYKNSFLGCAMAFRVEVLSWVLPFPENIPMHDEWIGLMTELRGKTAFIDDGLTLYRRHAGNVSSMHPFPWKRLIYKRLIILRSLVIHKPKAKPALEILIYAINYYPEPTGSGFYTGEMSSWLAERGHFVDAIAASPYYPQWRVDDAYLPQRFFKEVLNKVRVMRVPVHLSSENPASPLNRIVLETSFSLLSLRYWLPVFFNKRKYDVVVVISPPLQAGFLPWVYKALRGVPFIMHTQDLQVDAAVDLKMIRSKPLSNLLFKAERRIMLRADLNTTITINMLNKIVGKGIETTRTALFPNWSDIDYITDGPRLNDFRKSLNVDDETILFIYAGNMGVKQGLEIILEAAKKIERENLDVSFLFVGEGAMKDELMTMSNGFNLRNVNFLPVQPYEKLPELLNAADVHLIIQKREAGDLVMPSKLTNILAAGRPCIVTATSGTTLHSTIREHDLGLVCEPDDSTELAACIHQLALDPNSRRRMGQNGRNYAEKFLRKNTLLTDFERRLKNVVDVNKRRTGERYE